MKLSDRLFEDGVFAQGIGFPTVAQRQGARAHDRHRHAHARRPAVRARRVQAGRAASSGSSDGTIGPAAACGRAPRPAVSRDDAKARRLGVLRDLHARPEPPATSSGCSRSTRRRPTASSRAASTRTRSPALPWHVRCVAPHAAQFFVAFTARLSPARRALYGIGSGHRARRPAAACFAGSLSSECP